ncbi:MAG: 4Fe-4S cluster-binding domain-containing protein, partial [Candidatus Pacebacteria bacterium]|nr:4Fe-4S cluster-binding domain-containing protein [Candidatus Paceibacterota bacterium]
MIYGGLQKLTLIDFPGKLAATIFINGCNFRCPFCYNPNLVLPEKISSFNQEEIFSFLNRRKGMIDGVVI